MMCDFCHECCSCHINPPCGFCVTHIECEKCGQLVCEDKAEEMTDTRTKEVVRMCPDCASKYY